MCSNAQKKKKKNTKGKGQGGNEAMVRISGVA